MQQKDIKLMSTEELLKIFYDSDNVIARVQNEAKLANTNKAIVTQELTRRDQVAQDIKVKVKTATDTDEPTEAKPPTDDADPPAHE